MKSASEKVLVEMHSQYLQALRQRESEVARYVVILFPALGSFAWLVREQVTTGIEEPIFTLGAISIILVLLLGAFYSLVLGYNFRCVLLQLAKLEMRLGLGEHIIKAWPRNLSAFRKRRGPPEIIRVFWLAFIVATVGVVVAAVILSQACIFQITIAATGIEHISKTVDS